MKIQTRELNTKKILVAHTHTQPNKQNNHWQQMNMHDKRTMFIIMYVYTHSAYINKCNTHLYAVLIRVIQVRFLLDVFLLLRYCCCAVIWECVVNIRSTFYLITHIYILIIIRNERVCFVYDLHGITANLNHFFRCCCCCCF